MPYYKVKPRSFVSGRELWIALESTCLNQALRKAIEYCSFTHHIYYPPEQYLLEIDEQEYVNYMSKARN